MVEMAIVLCPSVPMFEQPAMLIPGVLQTRRWHPAAGVFQQIISDVWVTMTPPPHHVTMLSPVQLHVGELPPVTGKVALVFYAGRRSQRAVLLQDYTLLQRPILIEQAGPLYVMCRPTTPAGHTGSSHLMSAQVTKVYRGMGVGCGGCGGGGGGGGGGCYLRK